MESPFEVLSVDPDADDEAVEQAYRERVKEAHPDQGGSVEEFRAVRRAYERIEAGDQENGAEVEPSARGETASGATGASKSADATPGRTNDTAPGQNESGTARAGAHERAQNRGRARNREREREQSDPASQRITSEVTYLDYDVLADFGWEADDEDLFEKAASADLDQEDYGRFEVQPGESLLEAAEDYGFAWPFACRGGACANCAIKLVDGELSMPASHVLPDGLMAEGIRLSCNGIPITRELKVLFNVKHMPDLEELLLPPDPFEHRYADD
ncbi:ferredoxin Fer [Halorussus litoreus]|uniref:ferredoxin Fer n=1 Tax=Halorussus litoreus TaxID=1710536 RepID=UPI000E261DFE|nr:ferredoxin Fer [Halorussus litoreus]